MSERTENLGRHVELRQQRLRLVAECEAMRGELRRALPPEEEVGGLDREKIINTALALANSLEELSGIDRKLDILARNLGL